MLNQILGPIIRLLWDLYIRSIVGQHFCAYKHAGSKLAYTHVHILKSNPDGVTGLGHDDDTNNDDKGHVTVSGKNGTKISAEDAATMALRNIGYICTAYFHECDGKGACPKDFTRIKVKCKNEEGYPTEFCVCYTLEHDAFEQWYEGQQWTNQTGAYVYPYTHEKLVTDTSHANVACGTDVVLFGFAIKSVTDCTGWGGAADSENDLVKEVRQNVQAAAAKIKCAAGCQKTENETFKGWRCQADASSSLHTMYAEACVQWTVSCK